MQWGGGEKALNLRTDITSSIEPKDGEDSDLVRIYHLILNLGCLLSDIPAA